ncbi:MAG TPA: transposase [Polyangiaceae bacterium]
MRSSLRSLRKQLVAPTVLASLRDSSSGSFRIAQYSVQENHLHLIVEADSKAALSTGMRGLMVRLAKRVNRLLFRRGRFWADRWHGSALTAPRQVRNALVYVLQNRKKHVPHAARRALPSIDPLSSAEWFDGFADPIPITSRDRKPPSVVSPRTWLLRTGWRRHGLIHSSESPRSSH